MLKLLCGNNLYKIHCFGYVRMKLLITGEKSTKCWFYVKICDKSIHCVKSVRIWSYSGPYFPAFELRENMDQNNSEYGHFSRGDSFQNKF